MLVKLFAAQQVHDMPNLNVKHNVARPDDVYERLISIHAGKSEAESLRINARLILLLINHIGDAGVVLEAIEMAARPPHVESAAAEPAKTPASPHS